MLYFCTTGYLKNANCSSIHFILKKYQKLNKNNSVNKFDIDFEILQKYYNCIVEDEQSRYYTEKEIALLQANYPTKGVQYCADLLNRSYASIKSKAKELSLVVDTHAYTEEEIAFLQTNYPIYGEAYCAEKLGRSKNSINSKANNLNLTMDKW